ncbi:MAG: hypothetical protein H0X17_16635 [Deltaproteobacteria bacterium]|nr:hypothetical protein [Deltaproteobacteria bacterium]
MLRTWLLLLGACGRIGFDLPPDDDLTPDDDASQTSDAPQPIAACAPTLYFTDELDNAAAGPVFISQTQPELGVVESGGVVSINFAPAVTFPQFAFYHTSTPYTAAELCVTVEVAEVPLNGGAAFFKVGSGMNEIEFLARNGLLAQRTQTNGTATLLADVPFDLAMHRFWRLRHAGTTTIWETSPDGSAFVQRASISGFFTVNNAKIYLGGGSATAVTNAGRARFARATASGT